MDLERNPVRPSNTRSESSRPGWAHPLPGPALDKVRTEISLHVVAYNLKRMIAIFGVGPLMTAIRPDRFAQAVRANRATDISIATFGEYSASPTSYDAFFHGLGQTLPSAGRSANVRSQTVSGSLSVGSRASAERR